MGSGNFIIGWADLLVLILVVVGILRGRKRGMSEELLDIIKWTLVIVVAGLLYGPGGRLLAQTSVISKLFAYVFAYGMIALTIVVLFMHIKSRIGEKLMSSDVFGSAEYYLGMAAGAYRYVCIFLVAMAFLNARYYSPADLADSKKFQDDNFGTQLFPTIPDVQREVFDRSMTGRLAQRYLHVVFIQPTAPGSGKEGEIPRRRTATVDQILDKK
jgi:uncharacterized membrane protein required for colicin V production